MKQQKLLSLAQACARLSISAATGRNWVRLGKLIPSEIQSKSPYFTYSYINQVARELESGTNGALKSRRNKTYISGNAIYRSYVAPDSPNTAVVTDLLSHLSGTGHVLAREELLLLVAECALQLLLQEQRRPHCSCRGSCLRAYLNHAIELPGRAPLLDALIASPSRALDFIRANEALFAFPFHYVPGEDTLGLLYLSLRHMGERKAQGAYYTPVGVVRQLIDALAPTAGDSRGRTFLDPCCGTGNFLLQLPRDIGLEHMFATDIEEDSVKIARINMALHFHTTDTRLICSHITCRNFLQDSHRLRADYVIGNPPWGYAFSAGDRALLKQRFHSFSGREPDSCDLFLEQALRLLPAGGMVSFVLPEALLSVKSHRPVREILLDTCRILRIDYLGNVFHQVQCPCILLQCEKQAEPSRSCSCLGTRIVFPDNTFVISKERPLSADRLSFYADDSQYELLQKLLHTPDALTLKGRADFALGIVTGSNRRLLKDSPSGNAEPILKGCDIHPYVITEPRQFLAAAPGQLQQMAPEHFYRAPEKLVYRFIGRQFVAAYDNKGYLTLNSCNIVIPRIRHMHIKYILAVLNSSAAQFILDMLFHSVKALRSHLEAIPLPPAGAAAQEGIIRRVDMLLSGQASASVLSDIDREVASLYGLTDSEYSRILRASGPRA